MNNTEYPFSSIESNIWLTPLKKQVQMCNEKYHMPCGLVHVYGCPKLSESKIANCFFLNLSLFKLHNIIYLYLYFT